MRRLDAKAVWRFLGFIYLFGAGAGWPAGVSLFHSSYSSSSSIYLSSSPSVTSSPPLLLLLLSFWFVTVASALLACWPLEIVKRQGSRALEMDLLAASCTTNRSKK